MSPTRGPHAVEFPRALLQQRFVFTRRSQPWVGGGSDRTAFRSLGGLSVRCHMEPGPGRAGVVCGDMVAVCEEHQCAHPRFERYGFAGYVDTLFKASTSHPSCDCDDVGLRLPWSGTASR